MKLNFFLVGLFLIFSSNINALISHTLFFSLSSLKTEIELNSDTITRIEYEGLQNISEPGKSYYSKESINNDGTYHFIFNNKSGQENYKNGYNKVKAENYKPLVVEGRTWWYDAYYYGPIEYGIRIGSKTIIDEEEWFKVYVYLHRKDVSGSKPYDTTYKWIEYSEDEGLVAYIREKDHKIYVKVADYHFPSKKTPWALMDSSPLFDNSKKTAIIYDFSDKDTFSLGCEWEEDAPSIRFNVMYKDIEASGKNLYNRITCTADDSCYILSNYVNFTEGIGVTGEWYEESDIKRYSLFYAPFYYAMTNGMSLISLKYVTDNNDDIIYQGSGGTKLWEQYQNADIKNISFDNNEKIEYFDLQGRRVDTPQPGSVTVRRQGTSVEKVIVR